MPRRPRRKAALGSVSRSPASDASAPSPVQGLDEGCCFDAEWATAKGEKSRAMGSASSSLAADAALPEAPQAPAPRRLSLAVLVPCFNEEATVAQVVEEFRAALPDATVYVYDNASSDRTADRARAAGAVVRREEMPGKGNVVRRMFADIDADVYLLVDGDATYDAARAPDLVKLLLSGPYDLVNGARVPESAGVYRQGHRVGNRLLTGLIGFVFGQRFVDILSGYKAFSRRFVKTFPALASGFEIETELTVHALDLRMPVAEIPTPYRERIAGSMSKLSTYRDGLRILWMIVTLAKEERPLPFFGWISLVLALISLALGIPVVVEFFRTGLVPRLPTAVLSMGIMVLSFLGLACGLILDTVTRGRREQKRLRYLAFPSVHGDGAGS